MSDSIENLLEIIENEEGIYGALEGRASKIPEYKGKKE